MIIDAHAHACGDYLYGDNIIKILDTNKTDKVVLVPGELNSSKNYSLPELAKAFPKKDVVTITNFMTKVAIAASGAIKHIYEGNYYVWSIASKYPERIIQFYWASLSRENLLTEMADHYAQWQFRGIKLHQCWEYFRIKSKVFNQLAVFAMNHKLPIFIHLRSKREVIDMIDFLKTHADVCIIIGHLFGLKYFIDSGSNLKNVYYEISSPALISPFRLNIALKHFGANKLILGSDTPYGKNNLSLNINRILSLSISNEEKELILGQNMKQLLNRNCA